MAQMENLNGKLMTAVIVLGVVFLTLLITMPIVVNHTKNKVIEELRNSYTPGPYTPGFDPDKIDLNSKQPQIQQEGWLSSWEVQRFNDM